MSFNAQGGVGGITIIYYKKLCQSIVILGRHRLLDQYFTGGFVFFLTYSLFFLSYIYKNGWYILNQDVCIFIRLTLLLYNRHIFGRLANGFLQNGSHYVEKVLLYTEEIRLCSL